MKTHSWARRFFSQKYASERAARVRAGLRRSLACRVRQYTGGRRRPKADEALDCRDVRSRAEWTVTPSNRFAKSISYLARESAVNVRNECRESHG
jgi:hypothetical protein